MISIGWMGFMLGVLAGGAGAFIVLAIVMAAIVREEARKRTLWALAFAGRGLPPAPTAWEAALAELFADDDARLAADIRLAVERPSNAHLDCERANGSVAISQANSSEQ